MFENILAEHNEEIAQGDMLKQIAESKRRQNDYADEALIYGRLYYTSEKLQQIQEDARKYLHKNIDVSEIKDKISEDSKSDIGELESLYNIENKIMEVKEKLDCDCDPFLPESNLIKSSLIKFVKSINGGDNNAD